MKHTFNFTLLFVLVLAFISCKDKSSEPSTTETTTATSAEPTGIKFITNASMAKLIWEGSKPGGKHSGFINISEGTLYVNDGQITAGTMIMDMNSINVTDLEGESRADLEKHLKGTASEGSADFFNVTKFPTAKFEITEIIGTSSEPNTNATITGNLTMVGVTKPVSFSANISMGSANISINTNPFTINRTDWGIKYASKTFFNDLKDKFIDDEIKVQISMMATTPDVK